MRCCGLLAMVVVAAVMSPVVVAQVTCPTDVIAEWRLDTIASGQSPDERADHPLFCTDDCPTPAAGQIGGALAFDGVDDGIAASSEPNFDFGPTDSFAFEAWVRPAASTGDFRFVLGRVQPGSVGWVLGQDGSGVAAFDLVATNGEGSDPTHLLRGTTDLSDGNWHHLVGVRDGASGQTLLYVDGVLEDSTTLTYTAGFDSDFAIITVGYATSSFGPQRFTGDLDAITVYNRALTPADITDLQSRGLAGEPACDFLAPAIASNPRTEGLVGAPFTTDINAYGTPAPTYSFDVAPVGASIDPATGVITWTPAAGDIGSNPFTVRADNVNGTTTQSFSVVVSNALNCPSGLVSNWPFDSVAIGDAAIWDYTGPNHLIPEDLYPMTVEGIIGESRFYDGVEVVTSAPVHPSFQFTADQSFTFEAWVQPENNGNRGVLGRFDPATGLEVWIGLINNGQPALFFGDNSGVGGEFLSGSNNFLDGQWHHLVGVHDAAIGQVRLYADGVNVGSVLKDFPNDFTSATAPLTVGWLDIPSFEPWMGRLDDVSLYDVALTDAEVAQRYSDGLAGMPACTAESPTITSTPTLYVFEGKLFEYDVEATGSPAPTYALTTSPSGMTIDPNTGLIAWAPTAGDIGLHPVTVTATNGSGSDSQSFDLEVRARPTCQPGTLVFWPLDGTGNQFLWDALGDADLTCDPTCPSPGVGTIDGALFFDGTNATLTAGVDPIFDFAGTDSFTFEAWILPTAGATRGIMGRFDPATGLETWIGVISGKPSLFIGDDTGVGGTFLQDPVSAIDGSWHHVAGVHDAATGEVLLYVDGVEIDSASNTFAGSFQSATAEFTLGWLDLPGFSPFQGDMDEVAIHDRALTAIELEQRFLSGLAGVSLCGDDCPLIVGDPSSVDACPGDTVVFDVTATGTMPFSYQWAKDGIDLAGETAATLTLVDVTVLDVGDYHVTITNSCGSVTSADATLALLTEPTIDSLTGDQDLCEGDDVTLSVTASGSDPLSYQWFLDGVTLPGETAATLELLAVDVGDAGDYTVDVTNDCGPTTSDPIVVSVAAAATVDVDPSDLVVCPGAPAVFTVTASGEAPLSYQWRKDGAALPGETSATLTIAAASSADEGAYSVDVSNACGTDSSVAATLTVEADPQITAQPQALVEGCVGSPFTLSVTAVGAEPLQYQWRKDGADIVGATAADFTVASASPSDAGGYDCVITNDCGSVTSAIATVTIEEGPTFTADPISQTACPGDTVTFVVTTTGTTPIGYQWRKDGVDLAGATSAALMLTDLNATDSGAYDCVATNACGSETSASATLVVEEEPAITTSPDSGTYCDGGAISIAVTATGTGPLSYQWRRDGVDLAGATAATLVVDPATAADAGAYTCVVTNVCGSVESGAGVWTVESTPIVTDDPDAVAACDGDAAVFSVTARGSASSIDYQWRKDGSPIAGATASSYTIASVTAADAGAYDCVVGNLCGSIASAAATLSVNEPVTITSEPVGGSLCEGLTKVFSVAANGTGPLNYQWRVDGADIPGATSSSYTIASVAPSDTGNYACLVTNGCGSVSSAVVFFEVHTPPVVTTHPGNGNPLCEGLAKVFSVDVTGSAVITYQWRKNGLIISGATSATYMIPSITPADSGDYDCVVSNPCATVTSEVASFLVLTTPLVDVDPAPAEVCLGDPVTFEVAASGGNLFYQWRRDGVDIAGATESSYTIPATTGTNAGAYSCAVINSCGSTISAAANLTVRTAPTIDLGPVSATACPGDAISFSVTASGSGPLGYQWREGGTPIAGATDSVLTIAAVDPSDAGNYDCVVTNACGSATSSTASLDVREPVQIVTAPINADGCPGDAASFTVVATGSGPLSFQWRLDGSPIAGATSSSYSIASLSAASAGAYDCVVTNACGSEVSAAAILTVLVPVQIDGSPTGATVCAGEAVSFTVSASGSGPLNYQWRKDGSAIPGATAPSLSFASVVLADAGSFDCVVSNACGSATSGAAILTVGEAPTVTSDPIAASACETESVTFDVSASGSGPLSYQWRKDGGAIAGATGASFTIAAVLSADAGEYDCVVTNACGSETSASATLTVLTAPVIVSAPVGGQACEGTSFSMTVGATGPGPLSYQWRLFGSALPSETADTISFASLTAANAGNYDCVVSNACGDTTTARAVVIVDLAPTIVTSPSNQGVCDGDTATLTVVADGATPLSFQWRKDGSEIAGATGDSLTLASVTSADNGSYDVIVTNGCGSVTSAAAVVTVGAPPTIVEAPSDVEACVGADAEFSVVASGTLLGYQWTFNGVDIAGATDSTLTIGAVGPAEVGAYACVVSSGCGQTVSAAAALTLGSGATIVDDPSDQIVCVGADVDFSVTATGTAPLAYQWQLNGVDLAGATDATLSLTGVTAADEGAYTCVVTGACGATTSAAATLMTEAEPVFVLEPVDATFCPGDVITFIAEATSAFPIDYQWRRNGVDLPGETGASLSVTTDLANAGATFDVVVTGACGTVTSAAATASLDLACFANFRRGDANEDGTADISDVVRILRYLFLSDILNCLDAGDTNDDGDVDVTDAVYLIEYLFIGGPAVPAPFGVCGPDTTPDLIGCDSFAPCP